MPGGRLEQSIRRQLPKYAVVGKYSKDELSPFVSHVALLRGNCTLRYGDYASVWHSAPPIVAGANTAAASADKYQATIAHVYAFLQDLTEDERDGIETTLAEIDRQTPRPLGRLGPLSHYTIIPPMTFADARTGTPRFRRFSCSGFVHECYREGAGIDLVGYDSARLPFVDLATLERAYPDLVRAKDKLREPLGIGGSGPWRILLAGYILRSLARPSGDVRARPFAPKDIDDATFPDTEQPIEGDRWNGLLHGILRRLRAFVRRFLGSNSA